MGHVEAGIVLEEIGRNLTPSPFLTSSVLAATALGRASDDLRGRYLPGLLTGESVFAVAIDEGAKHRPSGSRPAPKNRATASSCPARRISSSTAPART